MQPATLCLGRPPLRDRKGFAARFAKFCRVVMLIVCASLSFSRFTMYDNIKQESLGHLATSIRSRQGERRRWSVVSFSFEYVVNYIAVHK